MSNTLMVSQHANGRLLLGDNPYIGVEHLNRERSREKEERRRIENQASVVNQALDAGASGYVFSTHPANEALFTHLRDNSFSRPLDLYPLLPYAQEYVRLATEHGVTGLIRHALGKMSWKDKFGSMFEGAGALFTGPDLEKMLGTFLRMEMRSIERTAPRSAQVRAIFLHEVVTDLAVAFDSPQILQTYASLCRDELDVRPGFVTRNYARFEKMMRRAPAALANAFVMTPVNAKGFQMTPSRAAVEETLKHPSAHLVAMSTMAAGQLTPAEASEYLRQIQFPGSVVLGTSNPAHVSTTFGAFRNALRLVANAQ